MEEAQRKENKKKEIEEYFNSVNTDKNIKFEDVFTKDMLNKTKSNKDIKATIDSFLKPIEAPVEQDYYKVKALSASQIKQYLKSPTDFWRYSVYNDDRLELSSKAIEFGKAAHCYVLEPQNFNIFDYDIKEKDLEQIKRMKQALEDNDYASSLLYGLTTEEPFTLDIGDGFYLKGKMDGVKKLQNGMTCIIDYKTTGNSVIDWGNRAQWDFHDIQVAVYQKLFKSRYHKCADHFIFLVQSTKEGYENDIDYVEFDTESVERATQRLEDAIEDIKLHFIDKKPFTISDGLHVITNEIRCRNE